MWGENKMLSGKFKMVIPNDVREKLHLCPQERLGVVEKGGVITLVRKCG